MLGGSDLCGNLLDANPLCALLPDTNRNVAGSHIGDVRYIHHSLVHADSAQDGGAPALKQHRAAVPNRERGGAGVSVLGMPGQADPLPREEIGRLKEAHVVRLAVDQLSEPCRALIELLYRGEALPSDAEIARRLDISEGAVGPAQERCLEEFERILKEMGF